MKAWNIYLAGRKIDTVFTISSLTRADVYKSLVEHDGMSPDIEVRLAKEKELND